MSYLKYFLDLIFSRSFPKKVYDEVVQKEEDKQIEPTPIVPEPPKPDDIKKPVTIEEKLLISHNSYRIKNGKAELKLNDKLCEAAFKHAAYMDQYKTLSHTGRNRSMPWDRALAEGYQYRMIAENIAVGASDVDSVMSMWINSSGHRDNILGSYKDFGAAKMGQYWCVVFGV